MCGGPHGRTAGVGRCSLRDYASTAWAGIAPAGAAPGGSAQPEERDPCAAQRKHRTDGHRRRDAVTRGVGRGDLAPCPPACRSGRPGRRRRASSKFPAEPVGRRGTRCRAQWDDATVAADEPRTATPSGAADLARGVDDAGGDARRVGSRSHGTPVVVGIVIGHSGADADEDGKMTVRRRVATVRRVSEASRRQDPHPAPSAAEERCGPRRCRRRRAENEP